MSYANETVTFHHDNPDIPTLFYMEAYGVVVDINNAKEFAQMEQARQTGVRTGYHLLGVNSRGLHGALRQMEGEP